MLERKNQENNSFDSQLHKSSDFDKGQKTTLQDYDILQEAEKIVNEKFRQNFIDLMNA